MRVRDYKTVIEKVTVRYPLCYKPKKDWDDEERERVNNYQDFLNGFLELLKKHFDISGFIIQASISHDHIVVERHKEHKEQIKMDVLRGRTFSLSFMKWLRRLKRSKRDE